MFYSVWWKHQLSVPEHRYVGYGELLPLELSIPLTNSQGGYFSSRYRLWDLIFHVTLNALLPHNALHLFQGYLFIALTRLHCLK